MNYYKNNSEYSHLLVRKQSPFQTQEENKLQIKVQHKKDYNKNLATLSNFLQNRYLKYRDYVRSKVTCECGSVVCHDSYAEHKRSKKHKLFIDSKNESAKFQI